MSNAVVQISNFKGYNANGIYVYSTLPTSGATTGQSYVLQQYHTVTFGGTAAITNFKQVYIYRRSISSVAPLETTGGSQAQYYGWGQWEYITAGGATSNITGSTVNMRGPTNWTEFNPGYGVTGGSNPTFLKGGNYKDGTLQNNKKIPIVIASGGGQQFLFVVQFSDNSFSTKGLLVNIQKWGSMLAGFNQLSPNPPTEVNVSAYNSYTPGMLRNLNEARSLLSVGQVGWTTNIPTSPLGDGNITSPLAYPTGDSTNAGTITPGIV
jgi:hypothetical protein